MSVFKTKDQTDMAKFLIQNGAQINVQDNFGHTALHVAVFQSDHEAVKYLVENGAQVDHRDNEDKTPFDLANEKHYFEIAKLLLEKKRDSTLDEDLPNNIGSAKASCIICFEKRNGLFALIPCGHTILCEPCCYKLKNEPKSKCPNCRKPKPRLYENLFC